MRLRNLAVVAVTAAAAVTALAPGAGVSAARTFGHRRLSSGGCQLGLNVAPRHIAAGDAVTAYGRLLCRHGAGVGQAVQLFEHAYGTSGYTQVGATTTGPGGYYELPPSSPQSNSSFYTVAAGATSVTRQVHVEALVTLNGPTSGSQLLTGKLNKVTFTGTVNPDDAGAEVILQRQNAVTGNEWRRIGRGVVGSEGTVGTFTIEHTFIVPGDANIRVVVRSQGRNVRGVSNELSYEISQAQNQKLTINASADPIEFGQSVTIYGVAEGLADQQLTLLARVRHQHGFVAVAEMTTNGVGSYTFPAQSPSTSTFYEVRTAPGKGLKTGAEHSAVMFEGVKDILTASVSPNPVQAGQTLTFSGTVTPALVGHIVYLERQNASGNGFHVVQVGAIGAGSSYSLTYTVYDPGTKVYRVRIPGGPFNQGAASQQLTVTVTPAPAGSLKPEVGGNTSLPGEGSKRDGEEREAGYEGETPVGGRARASGERRRGPHGR
jgi:hypothetical protein